MKVRTSVSSYYDSRTGKHCNRTVKHRISDNTLEMLKMLRDGYTVPQIARKTFFSDKTLYQNLHRLYKVYGVSCFDELLIELIDDEVL